jgi:hypothetical protein
LSRDESTQSISLTFKMDQHYLGPRQLTFAYDKPSSFRTGVDLVCANKVCNCGSKNGSALAAKLIPTFLLKKD